jgi:hypothetical protein
MPRGIGSLSIALAGWISATGCGGSSSPTPSTEGHKVYFVGYVYDGASGARLIATDLTAISIKYRDVVITTKIEDDGRFVTQQPLPTWQDYAVYIGAVGYRPFVSRNPGVDVPAAISMTEAVANAGSTQTFQVEARLFPLDLKAPALTIKIDKADAYTVTPAPAPAAGTMRLRPVSASLLEPFDTSVAARARRWPNDEDLLAQTITMPFSNGTIQVADGSLLYGVTYELAVYDVPGYQPLLTGGSSFDDFIVGGRTTSRAYVIARDSQAKLRILSTNMDICMPPAPTSTAYGGQVDIRFSESVEFVGVGNEEIIDNGISIVATPVSGSVTTCQLRSTSFPDPTVRERGSRSIIAGDTLSLSFNPGVAFMATAATTPGCMLPSSITAISYGTLTAVSVRPVGDDSRKKTIATLIQEAGLLPTGSFTGTIVCGPRSTGGF